MMQALPDEILKLSLMPKDALLLRLAARDAGCPIDQFVLESALARANGRLPDRRHFGLDARQWTAFLTALDGPLGEPPA